MIHWIELRSLSGSSTAFIAYANVRSVFVPSTSQTIEFIELGAWYLDENPRLEELGPTISSRAYRFFDRYPNLDSAIDVMTRELHEAESEGFSKPSGFFERLGTMELARGQRDTGLTHLTEALRRAVAVQEEGGGRPSAIAPFQDQEERIRELIEVDPRQLSDVLSRRKKANEEHPT
jgi:hypothetical protein